MTEKERLLEYIYKVDDGLNKLLPDQRAIHAKMALLGRLAPKELWDQSRKNDSEIEKLKKTREFAQDVLFVKYKTVVLAKWQEAEP